MKSLKFYELLLFILIALNCVDEYENKKEEKSMLHQKRYFQVVVKAKKAYDFFIEVRAGFCKAGNAYKCLKMGVGKCMGKVKDSFFLTNHDEIVNNFDRVFNNFDKIFENFDKVFDKLDKLSNQFSTELKCEFIEQKYIDINEKINRIRKELKIFLNDKNPNEDIAKKSLQNLCRDNTEGIGKILSLIENYLKEEQLIKIAKNCYKYNFDKLEDFHYETLTMILQFMIVGSNCEQLFNYNKFDYNLFWHETENYLNYYKDFFFPIVFSRDSGYNGLNQTVKRIFKENKENFKKTVEQLNKDYNFFDWTYLQWNTIIFATDSAAKPFIDSRPRIRSQTFSLPENEIKSNDLDLKESKI